MRIKIILTIGTFSVHCTSGDLFHNNPTPPILIPIPPILISLFQPQLQLQITPNSTPPLSLQQDSGPGFWWSMESMDPAPAPCPTPSPLQPWPSPTPNIGQVFSNNKWHKKTNGTSLEKPIGAIKPDSTARFPTPCNPCHPHP